MRTWKAAGCPQVGPNAFLMPATKAWGKSKRCAREADEAGAGKTGALEQATAGGTAIDF